MKCCLFGLLAVSISLVAQETGAAADAALAEGIALARQERFAEANAALLAGQRKYPTDPRFLLELAGVSYRLKHTDETKKRLRQALRLDPVNTYGNEFLATLHLLDGNLEAALMRWNRIGKPLLQEVVFDPAPAFDGTLLHRAVTFSGGQILTLSRLHATERNLDLLNVFVRRQLDLAPSGSGRYIATYRLLPSAQPLSGRWATLLTLARGLPYQAVSLEQTNLANRAWNARGLYRWDAQKRRVAFDFGGPLANTPSRAFRFSVDGRDEHWDLPIASDVRLRRAAAEVGATIILREKFTWTTAVRASNRSIAGAPAIEAFDSGWTIEQRNQFDLPVFTLPEQRFRLNARAGLRTGRFLGRTKSSRILGIESAVTANWLPQSKGDDWEIRGAFYAGTISGVPFDDYFQLGMERDSPYWIRGVAGSRDGRKGAGPIGSSFALAQSGFDRTVLRIPFLRVKAGPFFDTGRVSGFTTPVWRSGTGAQIRLVAGGGVTWSLIVGRDLRRGEMTFYSTVSKIF
jgi:tetratricopeptide (TPR) repeat protein